MLGGSELWSAQTLFLEIHVSAQDTFISRFTSGCVMFGFCCLSLYYHIAALLSVSFYSVVLVAVFP